MGIPDQELAFREALHELTGRGDVDDLSRKVIVTPYEGAYGIAGAIVTVNGSPPCALVLVTADKGRSGATVCVFGAPGSAQHPLVMDQWTLSRYRSGKKREAHKAILEYLTFVGVFHKDGSRNFDATVHVSEPHGHEL